MLGAMRTLSRRALSTASEPVPEPATVTLVAGGALAGLAAAAACKKREQPRRFRS